LLRMAPHLIHPLRLVLPAEPGMRPAWMLWLGLLLYDHLGGRKILPPSRTLDLRRDPAGVPLNSAYTRAFEYSDCWVDDARLVVLNARDAASHGALILTRTRCTHAVRQGGLWRLTLTTANQTETRAARVLINAAGPWVANVLNDVIGQTSRVPIRLVKGSHLVVRRLFDHDRCYIFQNADRRICFAIPYEDDFTLIGTTDLDYSGDPADVAVSPDEDNYLLTAISAYLVHPIDPTPIVWRYSGVRPLRDDGATRAQDATRDYILDLDGDPPLLSAFGGKITTYRRLAEAAIARLTPFFPNLPKAWTASAPLPGGDFPWDGQPALRADLHSAYPFLPARTIARLARSYGTLARNILGDARQPGDLGRDFGAGLTERETDHLIRHEWARTPEDILWRRSKLGLHMTEAERAAFTDWFDSRR
ncbi:MAG: glycerol-3-phosphate dehydrogenase, partial [Acetobacteraceae bacterium]|nr:glycerol-3-phosphate dehydrogenase [Acetobacteraceae bacterium]